MLKRLLVISLFGIFYFINLGYVFAQDTDVDSPFDLGRIDKQDMAACLEKGIESESCKGLINRVFSTFKPHILENLDQNYERMEEMVERAKAKENLTDEEKEELDALLIEYKAFIDELKDSINNATDVDDLKAILEASKADAKFQSLVVKLASARRKTHRASFRRVIDMLEKFVVRVEKHTEAAQKVGHDISDVESYLQSAKDKIASVKATLDSTYLDELNTPLEVKEKFQELMSLLRDAHSDLKMAVLGLKNLYEGGPWKLEE